MRDWTAHALLVSWLVTTSVAAAGADPVTLRLDCSRTAVTNRPGVTNMACYALLHNERAIHQLSYEARVGTGVWRGDDRQTEPVRRPWAPYKPALSPEQKGYAPLGLQPDGNWDDFGFFNLSVNGVDLAGCEPGVRGHTNGTDRGVVFEWKNSQARVVQTFVMREGDERLYMRLAIEPVGGKAIESLALKLRCEPRMGNTAYGNPATRSSVVFTRTGEARPARRIELVPDREFWAVFANSDLGTGPAGVMFRPAEVRSACIVLGADEAHTVLQLDPGRRSFHIALWDMPKLPAAPLVEWLRATETDARAALDGFARPGIRGLLGNRPALRHSLHLVPAVYAPSPEEQACGYVVSRQDAFEYADANALPTSAVERVSMWASPGQTESASVRLYALRELGEVTVEPSELRHPGGGRIEAGAVDVRVVKVWPQRESLWWRASGEYELTPELLVRDDTLALSDAWPRERAPRPGLNTGPALARIARDTSRQFVVSVSVPASAEPGAYAGALRVRTADTARSLPLALEVLPIRLVSADDRYILGLYYRGRPQSSEAATNVYTAERVTPSRFRADLETIRKLGFNSVTCFVEGLGADTNYLNRAFPVYRELGFRAPVMLLGWGYAYNTKYDERTNQRHRDTVQSYLRYAAEGGYPEPAFYGIDEPEEREIETVRRRAEITREVSYGAMRGRYAVAGSTLGRLVGSLDYPIISSYFTGRDEMARQCRAYQDAGASPLYYWQIWGEYPKGARLNTGFFLYTSGFAGAMPYAYQHYDGDPYDVYAQGFRAVMLTYPAADGPVLTLQAAGARAGVVDLRYLLTLESCLSALERTPGGQPRAREIREQLAPILARYGYEGSRGWGRVIYGAMRWPEHQKTVSNAQFDSDRRTVADLILQCAGGR